MLYRSSRSFAIARTPFVRRYHRIRSAAARQRHRTMVGERVCIAVLDAAAVLVATSAGVWAASLIAAAGTVVALSATGQYRPRLRLSALDEAPGVLLAVGATWAVVGWLRPPVPAAALPAAPLWWWLVVGACVVIARALGYWALRQRRRRRGGEPAVVGGAGGVAVRVATVLLARPEFGLRPVGFLDAADHEPRHALPMPFLGPIDALPQVASQQQARNVIVAFPAATDAELVTILRECRQQGQTVFVVPRLFEMNVDCVGAEPVEGIPLIRMRPPPTQRGAWRIKRVIDVIGAALSLVLLSPLFLMCALAVSWEIGRDRVLFRQERVGVHGRRFRMMKFRTLTPSSDAESQAQWSISGDPRVGPVGRLLRSTSLDELPQIVNVLRGEMSLVGPRPERPYFVEKFQSDHPRYMDRHRVPAGMTGWAQIHGLRGDTSIKDRAAFDNYYIENWSLALDIKIMLRTISTLIRFRDR